MGEPVFMICSSPLVCRCLKLSITNTLVESEKMHKTPICPEGAQNVIRWTGTRADHGDNT